MSARVVDMRFGIIGDRAKATADAIKREVAETIAQQITARWRDHPARVERQGDEYVIVVGDRHDDFYVGFLEYGTVHRPAAPVVTPTADNARDDYVRQMSNLESGLR